MTYIDDEIEKFAKREVKYLLEYVDWDIIKSDIKTRKFKDKSDVEEYEYELVIDAYDGVRDDIGYFVSKFDEEVVKEWVEAHFNEEEIEDMLEDGNTYADILYDSLVEVDFLQSEILLDDILYEYAYEVCDKMGLENIGHDLPNGYEYINGKEVMVDDISDDDWDSYENSLYRD